MMTVKQDGFGSNSNGDEIAIPPHTAVICSFLTVEQPLAKNGYWGKQSYRLLGTSPLKLLVN